MFNPLQQSDPVEEIFASAPSSQWVPAPRAPERGWLSSGLITGLHELGGMTGSAIQAGGKLVGAPGVETFGRDLAESQNAAAQASGRSDLETAPWREGGSPWLPYIGYQAAKNIPLMGAMALGGAAMPEAAVPAALSRAGAAVPRLLGGGRGLAAEAAAQAGKEWAKDVTGAAIVGYPAAVGSMYQEAAQREAEGGEPTSRKDAAWAAALGVPYAMADALAPAQLKSFVKPVEGGVKGLAKHVLTAGAASALEEVPQEALQTAMEQSFRTDLPVAERMRNVVDAAITGGLVGGVFGGGAGTVGGVRSLGHADPNSLSTDTLDATTKAELEPEQAGPAVDDNAPPPPPAGAEPIDEPPSSPPGDAGLINEAAPAPQSAEDVVAPEMEAAAPVAAEEPVETAPVAEERAAPSIKDQFIAAAGPGGARNARTFLSNIASDEDPNSGLEKLRAAFNEGNGWQKLPKSTQRIMTEFGLADAKGNAINFDKKINSLQKQIDNAQKKAETNPGMARKIADWTDQRDNFVRLKSLWSNVDASKEQSAGARLVGEEPQGGAGVRERDQQISEGQTAGAGGQVSAAEGQVQGQVSPGEEVVQAAKQGHGLTDAGPEASGIGVLRDATPEEIAGYHAERQRMWADLEKSKPTSSAAGEAGDLAAGAESAQPLAGKPKSAAFEKLAAQSREWQQKVAEQAAKNPTGSEEANPTIVNYRRADQAQSKPSMSDKAFDTVLSNTLKSLGPDAASRVTVVPDAMALPQKVRDDAKAKGFDIGGVHGVNADGHVYIVRGNMTSPGDVQNVLRHEILGHGGASALFGKKQQPSLAALWDKAGGLEGLQKAARGLNVEANINHYLPEDVRSGARKMSALTPSEKAQLADELLAHVSEGVTAEQLDAQAGPEKGKFRKTLEKWVDSLKDALVSALDKAGFKALAQRYRTYTPQKMATLLREMHAAAREPGANWNDEATAYKLTTPQSVDEALTAAVSKATKIKDQIFNKDVKGKALDLMLPWMSVLHIANRWGKKFGAGENNPVKALASAEEDRGTAKARFATMFDEAWRKMNALPDNAREQLSKVMGYTALQIDPFKALAAKDFNEAWEQHQWLHKRPNEETLKTRLREAIEDARKLKQMKGYDAYKAASIHNELHRYAAAALSFHNILSKEQLYSSIPLANTDPMEQFLNDASLHSLTKARDFWKEAATQRMKEVDAFLTKRTQDQKNPENKGKDLAAETSDLNKLSQDVHAMLTAMDQFQYFHLGRHGKYMVTFGLKRENGIVDEAAAQQVAQRIYDAGFKDVVLSADQNNQTAFIRLDTRGQAETLAQLAGDLQKEGLISSDRPIKRGDRFEEGQVGQITTAWMNRIIDRVDSSFRETDSMTDEERAEMDSARRKATAQLRQMFLDLLPDTSVNKVFARRDYVPGYDRDMMRSFAFRAQVGANGLANMAAARKISDALSNMRGALDTQKADLSNDDVYGMQQVFRELMTREYERPGRIEPNILDRLRSWNHAYFLGLSPSYAALNMIQMHAFLLPELAKHSGFTASARNIGKATGPALQILKETFNEARKLGGVAAFDAILTKQVIDKVLGENSERGQFLLQAVNRGNIDIGSAARELTRAAEGLQGTREDNILRMAASFGYYSETFTRLVAALSAYDAYKGGKVPTKKFTTANDYADHVVNEAMLNYSQWNTARAIGRKGIFGPASPLMFTFMNYQMQVLEKLYREAHDAFSSDPQLASEARTFLAHHAAAMMIWAGSLGLPFAAVAAGAIDKLRDLFGDPDGEKANTVNDWRGFLSDVFGRDVGEVLARGAPRALGFDVSQRAGEGDIAPFSKLLTDKRKMEDAIKDYAFSMWGAPASAVNNLAIGGRELLNGNVIDGMKKAAPIFLKGPIEAVRMVSDGYVDAQGRKLPMEPGAVEILAQALGFNPAQKAEYSEQRHILAQRKDVAVQQSSRIRQNLATAMEKGDQEAVQQWTERAQDFDRSHPGYEILPKMGATLQKRAKARAQSTLSHVPLETSARDVGAALATDWVNWSR